MPKHLYRIEHWRAGKRAVIGTSDDPIARIEVLEPVADALLDRNLGGEVLLVEESSGVIVARRPVWLPGEEPPVWWAIGDVALDATAGSDLGG